MEFAANLGLLTHPHLIYSVKIAFSEVLFGKKARPGAFPLAIVPNFFFALCLAAVFSGCQSAQPIQKMLALPEEGWHQDSTLQLTFSVPEAGQRFDLLYQLQYQESYPFDNIYLKYWLTDPKGDTLISSLDNLFLFEPRVGKPIGSGLANHRMLDAYFLKNILLQQAGDYTVHLKQYMRKQKLEGIRQIGVKLRPARD